MKKDITTSDDITLLVHSFYSRVLKDEILAPIFIKQNFDLESHLPIMISFWEGILLDVHSYKGNPVKVHQEMNRITPLSPKLFDHWLSIWTETVTSLFDGKTAEEAIFRAKSIASVMQAKLING